MPALPQHPVGRRDLPVLVADDHRRVLGANPAALAISTFDRHGHRHEIRRLPLPDEGRREDRRLRDHRPLSRRELEVLTLAARGFTGTQIAAQLQLSESTVETHVRRAVQALGAHNRVHAVALAIGRGLIDPPRC